MANHTLVNSSLANSNRVKRTKSMPGGHRPTNKQLKSRKVSIAKRGRKQLSYHSLISHVAVFLFHFLNKFIAKKPL